MGIQEILATQTAMTLNNIRINPKQNRNARLIPAMEKAIRSSSSFIVLPFRNAPERGRLPSRTGEIRKYKLNSAMITHYYDKETKKGCRTFNPEDYIKIDTNGKLNFPIAGSFATGTKIFGYEEKDQHIYGVILVDLKKNRHYFLLASDNGREPQNNLNRGKLHLDIRIAKPGDEKLRESNEKFLDSLQDSTRNNPENFRVIVFRTKKGFEMFKQAMQEAL